VVEGRFAAVRDVLSGVATNVVGRNEDAGGTFVDLTGKVAVVTGTANPLGIGIALCRAYAKAGARVVLADIDATELMNRVEELRHEGFDAAGFAVDVGSAGDISRFADDVFRAFDRVDVLHLNHVAPSRRPGEALLAPEADAWELAVNVNLLGVVRSIKAFVPRMIAADAWGYVLATVSGAGMHGLMYGMAPYAVTKSAVTSVMECLHGQLRDVGSTIHCGVLEPGVVSTRPEEIAEQTAVVLRENGLPATVREPAEVASYTLEAIEKGLFWVSPTVADDARLTGGRHRGLIEWSDAMIGRRAERMINRESPDPYLWGPPANSWG
jgi:NAD(P)-dependent dehydrogenase (short-subunit alcohol dehydrogenase family)